MGLREGGGRGLGWVEESAVVWGGHGQGAPPIPTFSQKPVWDAEVGTGMGEDPPGLKPSHSLLCACQAANS